MTTTRLLLATLLAGVFSPALADEAADPAPANPAIRSADGVRIAASASPLVQQPGMRAVKNAPYSAEMVTERQQNLADGNQIVERHGTRSFRDGAGRTRQEVRDAKGELQLVTLHDPGTGTTWILRPQDRTATRIGDNAHWREVGRKAGEAARARIEQLRKEGKLPDAAQREAVIVKRVDGAEGDTRKDVRIQAAPLPGSFELTSLTGAFADAHWAARPVTKELGTREFDGVKATGRLRSYEIPAGAIGNRNPIVVSDERWFAQDLQITVYAKHSDPRTGEVVSRIENVKREEPAPELFVVPADYTVKDALQRVSR